MLFVVPNLAKIFAGRGEIIPPPGMSLRQYNFLRACKLARNVVLVGVALASVSYLALSGRKDKNTETTPPPENKRPVPVKVDKVVDPDILAILELYNSRKVSGSHSPELETFNREFKDTLNGRRTKLRELLELVEGMKEDGTCGTIKGYSYAGCTLGRTNVDLGQYSSEQLKPYLDELVGVDESKRILSCVGFLLGKDNQGGEVDKILEKLGGFIINEGDEENIFKAVLGYYRDALKDHKIDFEKMDRGFGSVMFVCLYNLGPNIFDSTVEWKRNLARAWKTHDIKDVINHLINNGHDYPEQKGLINRRFKECILLVKQCSLNQKYIDQINNEISKLLPEKQILFGEVLSEEPYKGIAEQYGIKVPDVNEIEKVKERGYWIVEKGQSLSSVARELGLSVSFLESINILKDAKFNKEKIRLGQHIYCKEEPF